MIRRLAPLRLIAFVLCGLAVLHIHATEVDNAEADNQQPLTEAAVSEVASEAAVTATLPTVRLTPPVVEVQGLEVFSMDLSGPWAFTPDPPEVFSGQREQVETWHTVTLPGHPALQGFAKLPNRSGGTYIYHREVDVPADWLGRAIRLRFGSLDGRARLWVNAQPVASSDSAFLPVEFDVTPHIRPGRPNTIAVSVEVSDLTAWYLREMGGVGRAPTLIALPKVNVSQLHADTLIHGDGSAVLRVHVGVENQSTRPSRDARIQIRVTGPDGVPLELAEAPTAALESIPGGSSVHQTFTFPVRSPRLWTPETPTLYTARVELNPTDGQAMTAERRFGFRDIRVDGHRLLVNGKPTKLFGANYHLTYPGHGHFPPGELLREDVRRLRDLNLNALRAWPTPYREYVDACNELGVWTTIEAPVNLQLYAPGRRKDHGNDPALLEPYLALCARMVETYRSDPSVLLWGLANESIYHGYFRRGAEGIRKVDPTRPIFFGGDGRMGVGIPGVDVNDEHYPRGGVTTLDDLGHITGDGRHGDRHGWQFPGDRPAISSEWCHTHVNNRAQIALDPGIDDYWGFYAQAHAEWTRRTPNFLGGFIFLSMPYVGLDNTNTWRGFFDDHRRPTTYAWHVKKACSPIRLLGVTFDEASGHLRAQLEHRDPWGDLGAFTWRIRRGEQETPVALATDAGHPAEVALPWTAEDEDVELLARSSRGFEVDCFALAPTRLGALGQRALKAGTIAGIAQPVTVRRGNDGHYRITDGTVSWVVDETNGQLLAGSVDGRPVLRGGPHLIVRGNGVPGEGETIPPLAVLPEGWSASHVDAREDAGRVIVEVRGAYNRADGGYTLTFGPRGKLDLEYDFTWSWETPNSIDAFAVGLGLDVAAGFDIMHWERNALWTTYPADHIGRPIGRAPARGEKKHATAREAARPDATPVWPWSQDLADGVTRDFRSSKLDFKHGGLFDAANAGVLISANGRQHLHAIPRDRADPSAGFRLVVNDFTNGGTEYHLMKSIRLEHLRLQAGTPLRGQVSVRLVDAETMP